MHKNALSRNGFSDGERKTDFIMDVDDIRLNALCCRSAKCRVVTPFVRFLQFEMIVRTKILQRADAFDGVNVRLSEPPVRLLTRGWWRNADMMEFVSLLQFSLQPRDEVLDGAAHDRGNGQHAGTYHKDLLHRFTLLLQGKN